MLLLEKVRKLTRYQKKIKDSDKRTKIHFLLAFDDSERNISDQDHFLYISLAIQLLEFDNVSPQLSKAELANHIRHLKSKSDAHREVLEGMTEKEQKHIAGRHLRHEKGRLVHLELVGMSRIVDKINELMRAGAHVLVDEFSFEGYRASAEELVIAENSNPVSARCSTFCQWSVVQPINHRFSSDKLNSLSINSHPVDKEGKQAYSVY